MVYFIDMCKLLVKCVVTKPRYRNLLYKYTTAVIMAIMSFVIRLKFGYIV